MVQRYAARMGLILCLAAAGLSARAAERVTLKTGFEVDCSRREAVGDRVRLYLLSDNASAENYMEVASEAIVRVETIPDPPAAPPAAAAKADTPNPPAGDLTRAEMHEMLAHAGEAHNIDEDLLASVVRAESGGHVHAVSRAGAQGLMQLMPQTANTLGVKDAFRPEENIAGGTAYLDQLLTRYHDNMALALAAYNAGPGAVDRYHGVPPYRETRAYVARVIREFNRRKLAARAAARNSQQK